MRIATNPILFVLLLTLCQLLSGCAGFLPGGGKDAGPLPRLERIAVLPMDRAATRPGQERTTCTLSDTTFEADDTSPQAAEAMTSLLFSRVEGDRRFNLVPEKKCIGFLNAVIQSDVKASQLKLIRSFGEELGAEAVLYGKLFRFDERVGSRYSVEKPASVAYTLHLIRVSDGAILWRSAFDETQKTLSENILNVGFYKKVGMQWLTAGELADYGLERDIEDLKRRLP